MKNRVDVTSRAARCRHVLAALWLVGVAMPPMNASAQVQDSYVDPAFGAASAIIRIDVFVGDRQGRAAAKEGMLTRQMSGWLSGDAEVLHGEVVHVGRGCNTDVYLADPAGRIALIERGGCTFLEKFTRAYNSGAIGVIAYNSADPAAVKCCENLVDMGPLTPGLVPIPGFFVARSIGLVLRATPVNVKIQAASFKGLKDAVTALQQDGTLTKRQAGSLKDTITAASNAASVDDFATALTSIAEFREEALALSNSGVLSTTVFQALDASASVIATRLQPPYVESA